MPEIRIQGALPSHAMPGFPSAAPQQPRPDMTLAELNALDSAPTGASLTQLWMSQHSAVNMSRGTGRGRSGGDFGSMMGAVDFTRGTAPTELARAISMGFSMAPVGGVQYGSPAFFLRDIDRQASALGRLPATGALPASMTGAALGGIPVNTGMAIPGPPGGWGTTMRPAWGVPAFLRNQTNGPGGGGGGAGPGGGGGGRGPGGGGWGGFSMGGKFSLPFIGAVGLEEAFFAPQTFGSMEQSALANADPYRRLVYGSAALGRAGGFAGGDLLDSIYQGVKPPEWMEKLGLGPTQAMGLLSNFGIVQQGGGGNVPLIQSLANMQFNPAFSGLDATGSAANAARYGRISGDAAGVNQYTRELAPVLSMAVEQGLDRASILRSIDAAVGMTARSGGIGGSVGNTAAFMMRYSSLPGGRTGEAGLSAMQQMQSGADSVGGSPLTTLAFSNAASGLKTQDQLKAFLNRTDPGSFDRLVSNPVGAEMVRNFLSAQAAGDAYSASRWLSQIVGNGNAPGALQELLSNNPFVQQLPPWMRPLASGMTYQQPGTFIAGQQGAQRAARQTLGDRNNNPLNLRSGPGGSFGVYPTLEAGVAGDVRQLLLNRDKHGLTTLRQQISRWAPPGENDTNGYIKRVAGGLGVDPDAPLPLDDPNFMYRLVQEMSKVEVGHTLPSGPLSTGIGMAMGGRRPNLLAGGDTRELGVLRRRGGGSPTGDNNIPVDALKAQSDALAGSMKGSEISFAEMNVIIPKVNEGLSNLATTLQQTVTTMQKLNRDLNNVPLGMPVLGVPP